MVSDTNRELQPDLLIFMQKSWVKFGHRLLDLTSVQQLGVFSRKLNTN